MAPISVAVCKRISLKMHIHFHVDLFLVVTRQGREMVKWWCRSGCLYCWDTSRKSHAVQRRYKYIFWMRPFRKYLWTDFSLLVYARNWDKLHSASCAPSSVIAAVAAFEHVPMRAFTVSFRHINEHRCNISRFIFSFQIAHALFRCETNSMPTFLIWYFRRDFSTWNADALSSSVKKKKKWKVVAYFLSFPISNDAMHTHLRHLYAQRADGLLWDMLNAHTWTALPN